MKLNTLQRSMLISLLYIGIFAGLVFIQFPNKARFQENAGPISISGSRLGVEDGSAFPAELIVSFKGLGFVFGGGRPVTVTSPGGSRGIILPRSYVSSARSVTIEFGSGVRLGFEASASGDSFTVSPVLPSGGPESIEFPYTLTNASLREIKEQSISIRSRGAEYDLSLGRGAELDIDSHVIRLGRDGGRLSLAARKKPVKIAVAPGSQAPKPMDEKAYRSMVDGYVDKAYRGLKEGRFDPVQEAWAYSGEYRFSEQALVALVAEALKRGQYGELSARINGIAKNKADRLTWRSDVYFGGIIRKTEALYAEDAAQSARISRLIQARDASVFEIPGLASFSYDRAPSGAAAALASFAASVDESALSPAQAVGVVSCLAEAEKYAPGSANPFLRFEPLIEKRILPAMVKVPEGYMLELSPQAVDLLTQLRAADALMAWGTVRYSEAFTGMGQALMLGALALSDEQGVLPASLALKGGAIASRTGALAPESAYPLVADNPWYPRQESLYAKAGPGTWAWTCAPELEYRGEAGTAVLQASWPQGMTHYLTVFGVKPFSLIQLYDIPYSPDSEFESYNVSGYLYVRSSATLFVKMKHKAERESIRLAYQ